MPRLATRFVAAGLALGIGLAGIGLLVLPQRVRADRLDREIGVARRNVAVASAFARTYHPEALDSADLFRLSKAMPSAVEMPSLLLQLDRLAGTAGITVDSFAPRAPVAHPGYRAVPIDLSAHGSFYALSDFLLRVRSAVRVRGKSLDVSGRLFAIDRLALTQPANPGDLQIDLTISAFTFAGEAALSPSTGPHPG
jgi:hypothetical protein